MKNLSKHLVLLFLLFLFYVHAEEVTPPKNLVFIIGDGMGFNHIKAANLTLERKLNFETFPHANSVVTSNVNGEVTDSAAGGTALATGVKVENNSISVLNGQDLRTILEVYRDLGKSTGIVTSATISDATPASFAAHATDRSLKCEILNDYFSDSKPNVIMGSDDVFLNCEGKNSRSLAKDAGYKLVTKSSELDSLDYPLPTHLYGGFGKHFELPEVFSNAVAQDLIPTLFPVTGMPSSFTSDAYFLARDIPRLHEMVRSALKILKENEEGFFLLIENEHTDTIPHNNKLLDETIFRDTLCAINALICPAPLPSAIEVTIAEMQEIEKTVKSVLENTNPSDTLIIVTADHETGGLIINSDTLNADGMPDVSWTSPCEELQISVFGQTLMLPYCEHTGANVGIFARGKGSINLRDKGEGTSSPLDNTDIVKKITDIIP